MVTYDMVHTDREHFKSKFVSFVHLQESYFTYLFGVTEPGCYGTVEIKTGRATLYVPRLPEEYAVWMGPLLGLEDFKKKYEVDTVHYVDEVSSLLRAVGRAQFIV